MNTTELINRLRDIDPGGQKEVWLKVAYDAGDQGSSIVTCSWNVLLDYDGDVVIAGEEDEE